MAQERPATPEKQLLKLIEEHKAKKPAAIQAQILKHKSLSLISLGAWLGRFSFSRDWFKKKIESFRGQALDIKLVNRISFFVICILSVYLIMGTVASVASLTRLPSFEVKLAEGVRFLNLSERIFLKKAVSFYLEKVRGRDIFHIGAVTQVTGPDGVRTTMMVTSSKILDATQDLKLVGISWSHDPDAMIEDTKSTRTYFVKTGQRIGDVKVAAIFKDKVVLSYGGEETELR